MKIKELEIYVDLVENDFRIKEISATEKATFQDQGK